MEKCPLCGDNIKSIPAGTSKRTGKPYKAFKVCSNDDCGYKPVEENGTRNMVVNSLDKPKEDNGQRTNAMVLSYAKDIVVALIEKGMESPDPIAQVEEYYKKLKAML